MAEAISQDRAGLVQMLEQLDTRPRWLSSWTVHNANHLRPKRDGLKVGGHLASCASMTAIMAALYFHALRPQDKVSVKPHAGPVLHAIDEMVPVINPPQALILGIGAGIEQPWKVDGRIDLATIMAAAAIFDHRAIDGAVAARFLAAFRAAVENPLRILG